MVTVQTDGTLIVFGEKIDRGDAVEMLVEMAEKLGFGSALEAAAELKRARESYPIPFNSAHEGFSVMNEEVDELWDEVRAKQGGGRSPEAMRKEAIQVAAMALRFVEDVVDGGREQV